MIFRIFTIVPLRITVIESQSILSKIAILYIFRFFADFVDLSRVTFQIRKNHKNDHPINVQLPTENRVCILPKTL